MNKPEKGVENEMRFNFFVFELDRVLVQVIKHILLFFSFFIKEKPVITSKNSPLEF
jgi:hypothetical protein